jgi:hypothetical protein
MGSTSAALLLGCLAPAAVLGICPARADGDIYVRTPRPAPHRQLIEGRSASEEPGSSYGRPGNDFGPGYPAGASSSPYPWAIGNQGDFPGTEFTRGR